MVCESANAFASSILSVIINGNPNLFAASMAPSFGFCVIRHAMFLLNAISMPVALIQCLMTISPVWASFKNVNLPVNPSIEKNSSLPTILPSTALTKSQMFSNLSGLENLNAKLLAASMSSIIISGKFSLFAVSIAPSLGSGVIRHAMF